MGENPFLLAYLKESWADWRHYNNIIWQLPSVAIAIVGGLLGVAYYAIGEIGPRTMVTFLAAFFALVMVQALRKHRKFHNVRYTAIIMTLRSRIGPDIMDPIVGDPRAPPAFRAYHYLLASLVLLLVVTTLIGFWNLYEWVS